MPQKGGLEACHGFLRGGIQRFGVAEARFARLAGAQALGLPKILGSTYTGYTYPDVDPTLFDRAEDARLYSEVVGVPFEDLRARGDPDLDRMGAILAGDPHTPWEALAWDLGFDPLIVSALVQRRTPFTILKTLLLRVKLTTGLALRARCRRMPFHSRALERFANTHLEMGAVLRMFGMYFDEILMLRASDNGMAGHAISDVLFPRTARDMAAKIRHPPPPGKGLSRVLLQTRAWLHQRSQSLYDMFYPWALSACSGDDLPNLTPLQCKYKAMLHNDTPRHMNALRELLGNLENRGCPQRNIDTAVSALYTSSPIMAELLCRIMACFGVGDLDMASVVPDYGARLNAVEQWLLRPPSAKTFGAFCSRNKMKMLYALREFNAFSLRVGAPQKYALKMHTGPSDFRSTWRRHISDVIRSRLVFRIASDEVCSYLLNTRKNSLRGARPRASHISPEAVLFIRDMGINVPSPPHFMTRHVLDICDTGSLPIWKKLSAERTPNNFKKSRALIMRDVDGFSDCFDTGLKEDIKKMHQSLLDCSARERDTSPVTLFSKLFNRTFVKAYVCKTSKRAQDAIHLFAARRNITVEEAYAMVSREADASDAMVLAKHDTDPEQIGLFRTGRVSLQVVARMLRGSPVALAFAVLYAAYYNPMIKSVDIERIVTHMACGASIKPSEKNMSVVQQIRELEVSKIPLERMEEDFWLLTMLLEEISRRDAICITPLPATTGAMQVEALRRVFKRPFTSGVPVSMLNVCLCTFCSNQVWRTLFKSVASPQSLIESEPFEKKAKVSKSAADTRKRSMNNHNYNPVHGMLVCDSSRGHTSLRHSDIRIEGDMPPPARPQSPLGKRPWRQAAYADRDAEVNTEEGHVLSIKLETVKIPRKTRLDETLLEALGRDEDIEWPRVEASLRKKGIRSASEIRDHKKKYFHNIENVRSNNSFICSVLPLTEINILGRALTHGKNTVVACVFCAGFVLYSENMLTPAGPSCGCHLLLWQQQNSRYKNLKASFPERDKASDTTNLVRKGMRELAPQLDIPGGSIGAFGMGAHTSYLERHFYEQPSRCRLCGKNSSKRMGRLVPLMVGIGDGTEEEEQWFFCLRHFCVLNQLIHRNETPHFHDVNKFISWQQQVIINKKISHSH